MGLSKVDLSISIELENGVVFISLFSSKGQNLRVPTKLKESNLDSFYGFFHDYIGEFQKRAKRISFQNWKALFDVLNFLHEMGCQLNFQLLRHYYRRQVEKFFQDSMSSWTSSGLPDKLPPVIELKTSDENLFIPLEFIPFFGTKWDFTPINNVDDLRKIAIRFPGFSTIVKRILTIPGKIYEEQADTELKNSDGLRIRHFYHADLEGADAEKNFFNSSSGIHYLGSWPDKEYEQDDFVDILSSMLWLGHGNEQFDYNVVDHIQHFSCHCETNKSSHVDYEIILAIKKNKGILGTGLAKMKITLGDLERKFGRAPDRDDQTIYPIIFLNACGGSKFRPGSMSSFPSFFLDINNNGFIGTEANIPDLFAADFSKYFYQMLLSGKSIGESIYLARWNFLLVKKNPLGILYTVYANPDIRVSKPSQVLS